MVATLLDAHTARGVELAAIYADADGARRDEINAMSGSAVFTAFYEQLKGIREYHRKFPIAPSTETYEEALLTEVLAADRHEDGFTGEEAEGRFVDMHALHEMYLNLKGAERIDYCAYLKRCTDVLATPPATARTAAYGRYVAALGTGRLPPADAAADAARRDAP